ncbi:MAG: Stage V sporulation protein E [Candidatus Beckwithbacteria bacterium GW2011_GWA2_43_10]|uniref:Probable peptidoglycan glycosyltransferase FtsW n=1 Tax=Candidatus Beckwithbacteria bacterium GW2011_GWA2_43_10 TaxID=1618369 RepID=A0A0G1C3V9_9BACT|nr:MAG: Stage V sporulation protein E [Candidatus Beckwithbacteria bacterium GW2011_GWA2_43_10]
MLKNFTKPKKPDFSIFILVILLTLFGIVMVYNASVFEAWQIYANKYHFLKAQLTWFGIGLLGLLVMTFISLNLIKKMAGVFFSLTLVLLVAVLIPGIGNTALGARRWINISGFNLQPTELVKLSLSIYLSAWLIKHRSFWSYLLILGIILGLIMLQPDLGTAIVIIFFSVMVYYVAGANWLYLLTVGIFGSLSGAVLILTSHYRKARLLTFLNPTLDPLGSSYHIRQALITIGSGGLFGLGLGQSRQKYQFLPQVTTDSIFAVIAEELGFLGASLLIIFFLLLVFKAFKIARLAVDDFSRLLATAIASWLAIQIAVNLAAMLALIPLTGVPLPFISYGGSSLIVNLTAVGLLLNISRYQLNPKKK